MSETTRENEEQAVMTPAEFRRRMDVLCESEAVQRNISAAGGFPGLAKHLRKEALQRMGIRETVSPITGQVLFYALPSTPGETA